MTKLREMLANLDTLKSQRATTHSDLIGANRLHGTVTQSIACLEKLPTCKELSAALVLLKEMKKESFAAISLAQSNHSKLLNEITKESSYINHVEKNSYVKVVATFNVESLSFGEFIESLKNIYDSKKALISQSDFKSLCFSRYAECMEELTDAKPSIFSFITTLDLIPDLEEIMGLKAHNICECNKSKRFSLEINSQKYKEFYKYDILNIRTVYFRIKNNG
jgi:hypothetical protein